MAGLEGGGATVNALFVAGSDVYAGGYVWAAAGGGAVIQAGFWRNGSWTTLANPTGDAYPSQVKALTVSGGRVYAAGWILNASSQKTAGYWLDGTWTPLPHPGTLNSGKAGDEVVALVVSNGDVYAVGSVSTDPVNVAGYWKNGVWQTLANPAGPTFEAGVNSLVVSGSDVYAGGWATDAGSIQRAGYWKNGDWNALANPVDSGANAWVRSLAVSGSDVYAAGAVTWTYHSQAGYWRNGVWTSLITPGNPVSSSVVGLVLSGGDIFAVGLYDRGDEESSGYWRNGLWVGLPNQVNSAYSAWVTSLVVQP